MLGKEYKKPPKAAQWFLELIYPDRGFYTSVGDFGEVFNSKIGRFGMFSAWMWYWGQVFKSLPSYIKNTCYWSVQMLKNYLKTALRNIFRQKIYSFINITGLALGLACSILILLWVRDELRFDTFHKRYDNIQMTILQHNGRWINSSPWALVPILKDRFPEVEAAARVAIRSQVLKHGDTRMKTDIVYTDTEFFNIFTFPFINGNPKTAFAGMTSAIITEDCARRLFGNTNPMGKTLLYSNGDELKVTGIIRNIPPNSSVRFDVISRVELFGEERLKSWAVESRTYLLMNAKTSIGEFRKKIKNIVNENDTRTKMDTPLSTFPFTDIHLHGVNGGGPIMYVYIFTGIAFLILIIACINFMNLSSAKANARAKEIGVRKSLGAMKVSVIGQFLGESMIMAVIGLILAVGIVFLLLPEFNALSGKQFSGSVFSDPQVLAGILLITALAGLISGSYPALALAQFKPVNVLKGSFRSGRSGLCIRRILVTGQFVITTVLIISSLLLYRQIDFMLNTDLGMNLENTIVFPANREVLQKYETLKNELKANENILTVTAANNLPHRIGNINPVYWEGKTADDYVTINFVTVDYDYFEAFAMKFAYGRPFSRQFETDPANYVINEAALAMTGLTDPVGKMFSLWDREGKIIGVVKNFHSRPLNEEIRPIVFTLADNWPKDVIFIKIKPENVQQTIASIKSVYENLLGGTPFEYTFLEDHYRDQYIADCRNGSIIKYFSVLAIVVSCLGVFGMSSYLAEEKTKEIGVRKALGASVNNIIRLMSKEFILVVLAANIIAWPAGYFFMNKILSNYAYRTGIPLSIFAVAGVLSLLIAYLTASFQTLKAARQNPVDSLKYE